MTSEEHALADELFALFMDFEGSGYLFKAARTMELDGDDEDKEGVTALLNIFEERIEGEIKRLEDFYDKLFDFFAEGRKTGF